MGLSRPVMGLLYLYLYTFGYNKGRPILSTPYLLVTEEKDISD
jgi:hypothetical protein